MAGVHGTLGSEGDTLTPQPVCEKCQVKGSLCNVSARQSGSFWSLTHYPQFMLKSEATRGLEW